MLSKVVAFVVCGVLFSRSHAGFLQCSYSDSLESLDDLDSDEYPEKAGFICDSWPFYSGGFPKIDSSSSDSSDSSDEDDTDIVSLFSTTVSPDSDADDFNTNKVSQCLQHKVNSTNSFCSTWYTTEKGEEDVEICYCTESNNYYCQTWACIESGFNAVENGFWEHFEIEGCESNISPSSSSSSSSSSEEVDDSAGNQYCFVYTFEQRSFDFSNCWCKTPSSNSEFCLNWYCESYEFRNSVNWEVDDHGFFGCYKDDATFSGKCSSWYGFLMDDEEREEYRCSCTSNDDVCTSWDCGINEFNLRNNKAWYNFYLAFGIWVLFGGTVGAYYCYTFPFEKLKKCILKCRCCRMVLFFIFVGFMSMIHGGVPCFVFFVFVSIISMIIARKRMKNKGVVEFNEGEGLSTKDTTINGDGAEFGKLRGNSFEDDDNTETQV